MSAPKSTAPVKVVFSDLDGTLVHYPKEFLEYAEILSENEAADFATIRYKTSGVLRECVILTSMTGGKSYMSKKTVELIAELRRLGICFVIITGARSSTYKARRPLLPEADFEFFENGGRKLKLGVLDAAWTDQFTKQIGVIDDRKSILPELPLPENRQGTLWELYSNMKHEGWKLDARDYVANFRVDIAKTEGKSDSDFDLSIRPFLEEKKLSTTFNLGKADIYPVESGKANAARHVLAEGGFTAESAIAIFDDDNDLELGKLCGRSFLPGATHENVLKALKDNPTWTLTSDRGFLGTESALQEIIKLVHENSISVASQVASESVASSTA